MEFHDSLSGGQRQCLALARAVYSRKRILLADDVSSGADVKTSTQVFVRIFGPNGLCKLHGMTAVLCTHDKLFLPQADHSIVLRQDGTIAEQGTLTHLDAAGDYLHKVRSGPGTHSSESCELALRKVGLYILISKAGSLDVDMASLSLSQGQLRLFAVARTLLRKSRLLLVVDKTTSSVDSVAERVVSRLIRDEFKDSTVIAVAHRLQTIMDFDKIVVMNNGSIAEIEIGTPAESMQERCGLFHSMWERSGSYFR